MQKRIEPIPIGRVFHSATRSALGGITWAGLHINPSTTKPMAMRHWDTYSAVYVLAGNARFEDEFGIKQSVCAGDLLLMFPRHGYRYVIETGSEWSELFIQFHGPLFGMWLKERLIDPRQPIHRLEPIAYWRKRFEAMIKPMALPEPVQSLKRLCLLQDFLVDGVVAAQSEPAQHEIQWLTSAKAELENNYHEAVNWEALSRRFNLSYHRFRKKFTELGGIPPATYRAGKSIEHAEQLLRDGRLTVRDIAQQCGFYDEFHFAKRFKNLTGITPAQFRSRLR